MKIGSIIMVIVAFVVLSAGLASATKCIIMETEKTEYNLGENIVVTFTNQGKKDATVPYMWIENQDGVKIRNPEVLMYEVRLAPGESCERTWDQTDDSGRQVVAGKYFIKSPNGDVQKITIKDKAAIGNELHKAKDFKNKAIRPRPVGKTFTFL